MKNVTFLNFKFPSFLIVSSLFYIKREYHSSVYLSKEKINNKTIKNSYLLSYLDSIKEIINNPSYSELQKQEILEESWVKITKEKLENPKFLLDRYSNKLHKFLIKDALLTLNLLYENNIIKKNFLCFQKN